MSMNNDERLFMMMATIEQLVEQTKQQQAVITAQTEQITQLATTVEKQLETIKGLKDENLKSAKELETAVLRGVTIVKTELYQATFNTILKRIKLA